MDDVPADVLVAGIGNVFLTDDGFGPAVVTRLADSSPSLPSGVRVVDYGIRGMHLAYDLLDGVDLLVLVDALPDRGRIGEVRMIEVGPGDVPAGQVDAHGMDPATVLASLRALGGTIPPTVVVGCEVAEIDEGMGLSPAIEGVLDQAVDRVLAVLERERAEV